MEKIALRKILLLAITLLSIAALSISVLIYCYQFANAQSRNEQPARTQPAINQSTSMFENYKNRYPNFRLERTASGILTVSMNTNGGSLILNATARDDFPKLFHDIATDPENQVVILTGSSGTWIAKAEPQTFGNVRDPLVFQNTIRALRRSLHNLLDIEVPVIAAVDGPALINSHFALVNDIVLASERAQFQDIAHIPNVVPADGVQVVYRELLGPVRAKHFLWTNEIINTREALQLGLVSEVLPPEQLLPRANELAEQLLKIPSLTRRYTKLMLAREFKNKLAEQVPFDMGLEGMTFTAQDNLNNR